MSRVNRKKRHHQIKVKQSRKAKLSKLRKAYQGASSPEKKRLVLKKVFKIAPWLSENDFISLVKKEPREA